MFMGPREIMIEHFEFWTSDECPPLPREEVDLIERLADAVGVRLARRPKEEEAGELPVSIDCCAIANRPR